MTDALLLDLKEKLRITWDEDDRRLEGMLLMAQAYLNSKCNTDLDYQTPSMAKMLMLEWCFYYYHNQIQDFETAYLSEITSLILDSAIKKNKEDAVND